MRRVPGRSLRGELKDDESKLKSMAMGEVKISNRQGAVQYFTKQSPQFQRLFERADPNLWAAGDLEQMKEAGEEGAGHTFRCLIEDLEHPEAFSYTASTWLILVPHGYYVKHGLDTLELRFKPYMILILKVNRKEHKKSFTGWAFTYPSSSRPVAEFALLFSPEDLSRSGPPKLILPLSLLYGLSSNELEPEGCEIVRDEDGSLFYRVEGFEPEVALSQDLVNFLRGLGEDPLKSLYELGLLSKMTLQILEAKRERPLEIPKVRRKDRGYLRRIRDTKGYLTYRGGLLELTREGAYRALKRLEQEGLVVTDKHEGGEGIRVVLTRKGLAVIRELAGFNSGNQH